MRLSEVFTYKVGQVVAILCPNEENPKLSTYRPAIVLENREATLLVCPLTTKLKQINFHPKSFTIYKKSQEGKQMGLDFDSLAVVERIFEVEKKEVKRMDLSNCAPEELISKINRHRK